MCVCMCVYILVTNTYVRLVLQMEMQMKIQEEQEEILAFGKERRDYDARIRQLHEDRRVADEQWDERLR